jgi:hypothetical protein
VVKEDEMKELSLMEMEGMKELLMKKMTMLVNLIDVVKIQSSDTEIQNIVMIG